MKSILLSIRPEWVSKILNGEKTIEIRKKFPKDYVGWVYIYCTKDSKHDWYYDKQFGFYFKDIKDHNTAYEYGLGLIPSNGKVVARFWCDKVDGIICNMPSRFVGEDYNDDDATFAFESKNECMSIEQLAELACIEDDEKLYFYLNADKVDYGTQKLVGYAIHISKLEVFEKPRELWEFEKEGSWMKYGKFCNQDKKCNFGYSLKYPNKYIGCEKARVKKAPQNYCYVEEPTP